MNKQIIYFPKDGKPTLIPNEWQVWDGERDEGGIPDLEHGLSKVLVPFHWWITHHKNADVIARAQKGEIGVWFAADEDILKHADIIEDGKKVVYKGEDVLNGAQFLGKGGKVEKPTYAEILAIPVANRKKDMRKFFLRKHPKEIRLIF